METTSPATEEAVDLSVEGLLSAFGAPETFEINLPNGAVLHCRGFGSYAEKRQFEKDRDAFVAKMLGQKNAATKAGNDGLLGGPWVPLADLFYEENLAAAYTIHRVCVSPSFEPVDALKLTKAPALASYFMDQLSWNASHFLLNLKSQLYSETKKD
jgi:hypothetical protein